MRKTSWAWYLVGNFGPFLTTEICQKDGMYQVEGVRESLQWILNGHTTSNWRRFDVYNTSIHWTPNFHVFSTCFFNVISLIRKSTLFPPTFFDVILMVEKSTLVPSTFFGVNWRVKNLRCFHVFFFFWCNVSGQNIDVVFT